MAGDTLRDAFRDALEAIRNDKSIAWRFRDLVNTGDDPDASVGFLDLEFPGGSEDQLTFGAPGQNFWMESGQVTVRVYAPLGGADPNDRNTAERYARAIRDGFRGKRIPFVPGHDIMVGGTAPMGDGMTEAGLWAESVAIAYQVINIG